MKNAMLWVAGIFFSLTAAAQEGTAITPSAHKVKEERNTGTFEKLKVDGPFEVILTEDTAQKLTLQGADNLLSLIETSTENNTLSVVLKKGYKVAPSKHSKITVRIPYSQLTEIHLVGSGSITSKNTIRNKVRFLLDGAGSLNFDVYNHDTEVAVIGSGTVSVQGTTGNLYCKLTGSGSIRTAGVDCLTADVQLTGSGNIKVASTQSIKGRLDGSGTIAFGGQPEGQDLMRTGNGTFSVF